MRWRGSSAWRAVGLKRQPKVGAIYGSLGDRRLGAPRRTGLVVALAVVFGLWAIVCWLMALIVS